MSIARLHRWLESCGFSAARTEQLEDEVVSAYSQAGRYYHNFDHLRSSVGLMDRYFGPCWHLEGAIWFHDIIYEVGSEENEYQSARWFHARIGSRLAASDRNRIHELILATDPRRPRSADLLEVRMVDIDLGVLSADPASYDDYRRLIRREYAHVPAREFREARTLILESFLTRGVYHSPEFRPREGRARENLEREIQALREGDLLE